MSRIGKMIIKVPEGVEIKIKGKDVEVKGKHGEMSLTLPEKIDIENNDGELQLTRKDEMKKTISFHGLFRALVNNMVIGVSEGFTKVLILNGVGWRMEIKGKYLVLNLGYSHPIYFNIPDSIKMEATQPVNNQSELKIWGVDKEFVGLIAAKIRSFRKPEPYKGKGFRYSDEMVIRKAGKTAS